MVETAYALYLAISIAITIWVAHTLHSNGEVFLIQCFGHNEALAKSTNHLLVVGFYLVNIGFITLTLNFGAEPTTWPEAIRFLSCKVGLAVLVLGGDALLQHARHRPLRPQGEPLAARHGRRPGRLTPWGRGRPCARVPPAGG